MSGNRKGRQCTHLKATDGVSRVGIRPAGAILITVACRVLKADEMIIEVTYFDSQEFDDSHFFQRLTLIDICCGPPAID